MEDQISSPEIYSMKNSYNKIYILLEWKKVYIIKMFLIECKFILAEWKYILISWKKGDIIKIYFIEYKFVLIE